MKNVIVRLGNGLGNQLFTFSAAYSFAKKNKANLYIDNESGFYKRGKYELYNFNISASIVEKNKKFLGIKGKLKRKLLIKINKFIKNKKILIEDRNKNKLTKYNPEQLEINFKDTIYFEGFFQSEKYFKTDERNLRKELTFKNYILKRESDHKAKIKNSNSVSIHIRQNKFLKDEGHKNFEELNKQHFKNSVEIIKRGVNYLDVNLSNPKYFIFTDDFSKLDEFFPKDKFTYVDSNLDNSVAFDLHLMSLCKHFILSPSTLHYWGAFLSDHKNKICIAPKNILNKSGYYGFSSNIDIKPNWWKVI